MTDTKDKAGLDGSANMILDTTLELIREKLIDEATDRAIKMGRTVSANDILKAYENLIRHTNSPIQKIELRKTRLNSLVYLVGIGYVLVGFCLYVYDKKLISFNYSTDKGLIISLVGVLTLGMSIIYKRLLPILSYSKLTQIDNVDTINDSDYVIVKSWQTIEKLTKQLIQAKGSSNSNSVSSIIKFLENQFLSIPNEKFMLQELLHIRNQIVHEGIEVTQTKKNELLSFAQILASRLTIAINAESDKLHNIQ